MVSSRSFLKLIGLLAVCASAIAGAQVMPQWDFAKANLPKAKIALADLPDDYKAFSLNTGGGGGIGDMLTNPMMMLMMMMPGSSSANKQGMGILTVADVSFTRGETTVLNGVTFLITYKLSFDLANIQAAPTKAEFELTLVRLDSIKSIVPKPDVTKATVDAAFKSVGSTDGTPVIDGPTPVPTPRGDIGAAKTATLSNFKQASLAMIMYMGDCDDEMPYVQDTKSALAVTLPYTKNLQIFRSLNPNPSEYRLNMAVSGVNASEVQAPADTPLYYESASWPDGTRCVSFMDGHAKFVDLNEWQRLQPALHLQMKRKGKPLPPFYYKQLHFDLPPAGQPIPPTAGSPPPGAVPVSIATTTTKTPPPAHGGR